MKKHLVDDIQPQHHYGEPAGQLVARYHPAAASCSILVISVIHLQVRGFANACWTWAVSTCEWAIAGMPQVRLKRPGITGRTRAKMIRAVTFAAAPGRTPGRFGCCRGHGDPPGVSGIAGAQAVVPCSLSDPTWSGAPWHRLNRAKGVRPLPAGVGREVPRPPGPSGPRSSRRAATRQIPAGPAPVSRGPQSAGAWCASGMSGGRYFRPGGDDRPAEQVAAGVDAEAKQSRGRAGLHAERSSQSDGKRGDAPGPRRAGLTRPDGQPPQAGWIYP